MSDSHADELAKRVAETLEFLGHPDFDPNIAPYYGKGEDLPERIRTLNPTWTDDRLIARYWERPSDDTRPLTGRFLELGMPYWVHLASNHRIVVGKVVLIGFKPGPKSQIAQEAERYTVRMNTSVKELVLGGKWDHPTKVRNLEKIEKRDALKSAYQVRRERETAEQSQKGGSVTLWQALRLISAIDQRISLGMPCDAVSIEAQLRSNLLEAIRSHAGCSVDQVPAYFALSRSARRKFGEYRKWCNSNGLIEP